MQAKHFLGEGSWGGGEGTFRFLSVCMACRGQGVGVVVADQRARNFVPPTPRELCFMPCHAYTNWMIHPSIIIIILLFATFFFRECPPSMDRLPPTQGKMEQTDVTVTFG